MRSWGEGLQGRERRWPLSTPYRLVGEDQGALLGSLVSRSRVLSSVLPSLLPSPEFETQPQKDSSQARSCCPSLSEYRCPCVVAWGGELPVDYFGMPVDLQSSHKLLGNPSLGDRDTLRALHVPLLQYRL